MVGDKGMKGQPGVNGVPGVNGTNGAKGKKGDLGSPGIQGEKVGIFSIVLLQIYCKSARKARNFMIQFVQ